MSKKKNIHSELRMAAAVTPPAGAVDKALDRLTATPGVPFVLESQAMGCSTPDAWSRPGNVAGSKVPEGAPVPTLGDLLDPAVWAVNALGSSTLRATHVPDRPWRTPEPVNAALAFPSAALQATPLHDFVTGAAAHVGTAVDLAFMASIGALAGAVGGKLIAQVTPHWQERIIHYGVTAAPPSARKTPIFELAMAPLREREREILGAGSALDAHQRCMDSRVLRRRLDKLIRASADLDGPADTAEMAKLSLEIALLENPYDPAIFGPTDSTPEALSGFLLSQRGRSFIASDEAGQLEVFAGRYSKKPSLDGVLAWYSGGPVNVRRQGSPPVVLPQGMLNMSLMAQPSQLTSLVRGENTSAGRGLWARFALVNKDQVLTVPGTDGEVTSASWWRRCLRALLAIDANVEPMLTLELSTDARDFVRAHSAAMSALANVEDELLGGWFGKQTGRTLRLAGFLHAVEHHRQLSPSKWPDIPLRTLQSAAAFDQYFIAHARALLAPTGEDEVSRLLRWVRGRETYTVTEAHAKIRNWPGFASAASVHAANDLLVARGWVRPVPPAPGKRGPGAPRATVFEVHPSLR